MTFRARLRGAALFLGVLALCGSGHAAEPDVRVVREATVSALEAGPVWTSRAVWDPSERQIVIADPGSASIYVYDPSGRQQRRIANPGNGPLEFTSPNYAFRIGTRYLIATSPHRWIWFDENLAPQSEWLTDWDDEKAGRYGRLSTYDIAFSNTHLYAITAVRSHSGEWLERGIFAVSLANRSAQKMRRMGTDEEERAFYLDPPFNLTVCGGKAWLLEMGPSVSIVEARDGGKKLTAFPAEFAKRPSVPIARTADDLAARRAALRNSAVAEGLFCADDRTLLLLAHRPVKGGVQWLVYPIDPARDAMSRPVELPTKAGEIVFVPGQKRWAILEKGAMKYPSVQPLTRIVSFARPSWSEPQRRTAP